MGNHYKKEAEVVTTPTFAKLNNYNYKSWSGDMQAWLMSRELWMLVDNQETCPPDTDADGKLKWQKHAQKAAGERTLPSPIDSRWNPGGIMDSTFSTWSPGGILLAGSPAKLLSCSRWIPDGLWVDSRLSTWSPWSPPHSTSLDTERATFQWTPPGLKIA